MKYIIIIILVLLSGCEFQAVAPKNSYKFKRLPDNKKYIVKSNCGVCRIIWSAAGYHTVCPAKK